MEERFRPRIVALSLASVSGIFYVACTLLFALAPQEALGLFDGTFHGIDMTKVANAGVTFEGALTGFVEVVIFSFVFGWMLAAVYNYFLGRAIIRERRRRG